MEFWAREKRVLLADKLADRGKSFGDGIPVVTDLCYAGVKGKMQVLSGIRKRKNNTNAVKTKIKLRRKYHVPRHNRHSPRRDGYVLARMKDVGPMPGFPEDVVEYSGEEDDADVEMGWQGHND